MIADMIRNKKLNPVVTEPFIRGRKLNIALAFIAYSHFKVVTKRCFTKFYALFYFENSK